MIGKDNLKRGGTAGGGNYIQKYFIGEIANLYCGLGLQISGSGTAYLYDSTNKSYFTTTTTQNFSTSLTTDETTGEITIDGTAIDTKYRLYGYVCADNTYIQITSSSNSITPFSNNDGVIFVGGDHSKLIYYKIDGSTISLTNQANGSSYYSPIDAYKISDNVIVVADANMCGYQMYKISGNTLSVAQKYQNTSYSVSGTGGTAIQRLDNNHFAVCCHRGGYNSCHTEIMKISDDNTTASSITSWDNYSFYNNSARPVCISIPNKSNIEQHEQQITCIAGHMAIVFTYKIVNGVESINKNTNNAINFYNGYNNILTKDWFGHTEDGSYYAILWTPDGGYTPRPGTIWVVRMAYSNSTSGWSTSSVIHDIAVSDNTNEKNFFAAMNGNYCIRKWTDGNEYMATGYSQSIDYRVGQFLIKRNDGQTLANSISINVLLNGASSVYISGDGTNLKYYYTNSGYIRQYNVNS